jgi:glycosyltransferase involved in cell wall biosynthesis
MKIAMIAPIVERVPPKKYGGTERVIHYLTEELVRRGHDVTLFASGDSMTKARLVSVVPRALREMPEEKDIYGFNLNSLGSVGLAYAMQDQFDVIHDHAPQVSLPTANVARTPVVMTWHGPYDADMQRYFALLKKPYLVSISRSQREPAPDLNFLGTVYNGLAMEHYPFGAKPEDYMLFVGRIDPEKGVHHAIEVALRLKKKLIIAAKLDSNVPYIDRYFKYKIAPKLRAHPNHMARALWPYDDRRRTYGSWGLSRDTRARDGRGHFGHGQPRRGVRMHRFGRDSRWMHTGALAHKLSLRIYEDARRLLFAPGRKDSAHAGQPAGPQLQS